LDASRISFGEMVAGVSGLVLLIVMFFPWYGQKELPGTVNAWQAFHFIDFLLFLVVVVAVGMVVVRAAAAMPSDLPARPGLIVAGAGALAILLILFRLLDPPGFGVFEDTTRKIGVLLGLLAAAGIAFGGYTAAAERTSGRAPRG
jgi:hypothetical protein